MRQEGEGIYIEFPPAYTIILVGRFGAIKYGNRCICMSTCHLYDYGRTCNLSQTYLSKDCLPASIVNSLDYSRWNMQVNPASHV